MVRRLLAIAALVALCGPCVGQDPGFYGSVQDPATRRVFDRMKSDFHARNLAGAFADRPATAPFNATYYCTDTYETYRYWGAVVGWQLAYGDSPAGPTVLHNDLTDLQGGTAAEYYHLTAAEYGGVTGLTEGRVVYVGAGGVLEDSAALTWSGTVLGVTGGVTATETITSGGNYRVAGAGDNIALELRSKGTGAYEFGYSAGSGALRYWGGDTTADFTVDSSGNGYFRGYLNAGAGGYATAAGGIGADHIGLGVAEDANYRVSTNGAYVQLMSRAGQDTWGLVLTTSYDHTLEFRNITDGNLSVMAFSEDFPQIGAAAGTAARPSRSFFNDWDTGEYSPAANTIGWATGGLGKMRLDATGLGVGVTPTYRLDVLGGSDTTVSGRITRASSVQNAQSALAVLHKTSAVTAEGLGSGIGFGIQASDQAEKYLGALYVTRNATAGGGEGDWAFVRDPLGTPVVQATLSYGGELRVKGSTGSISIGWLDDIDTGIGLYAANAFAFWLGGTETLRFNTGYVYPKTAYGQSVGHASYPFDHLWARYNHIASVTSLPTAGTAYEGTILRLAQAGALDQLRICLYTDAAGGSWIWRKIETVAP